MVVLSQSQGTLKKERDPHMSFATWSRLPAVTAPDTVWEMSGLKKRQKIIRERSCLFVRCMTLWKKRGVTPSCQIKSIIAGATSVGITADDPRQTVPPTRPTRSAHHVGALGTRAKGGEGSPPAGERHSRKPSEDGRLRQMCEDHPSRQRHSSYLHYSPPLCIWLCYLRLRTGWASLKIADSPAYQVAGLQLQLYSTTSTA